MIVIPEIVQCEVMCLQQMLYLCFFPWCWRTYCFEWIKVNSLLVLYNIMMLHIVLSQFVMTIYVRRCLSSRNYKTY